MASQSIGRICGTQTEGPSMSRNASEVNPWTSSDKEVRELIELYWSHDPLPPEWDAAREALVEQEIDPERWRPSIRERTAGSGLYGYTVGLQKSAEGAIRKLTKEATNIARAAMRKDEGTITFLQKHAARDGSRAASVLLAAARESLPRIATTRGMYGLKHRTAELGMKACVDLRLAAGRIAADLHGRKTAERENLIGFFEKHGEEGKCLYSKLLWSCYPED